MHRKTSGKRKFWKEIRLFWSLLAVRGTNLTFDPSQIWYPYLSIWEYANCRGGPKSPRCVLAPPISLFGPAEGLGTAGYPTMHPPPQVAPGTCLKEQNPDSTDAHISLHGPVSRHWISPPCTMTQEINIPASRNDNVTLMKKEEADHDDSPPLALWMQAH